MSFLRLFGVMSPAYTFFDGLFSFPKKIGSDEYGNRYYQAKPRQGYKKPRRWVIYKGAPEATKVPPEWHGWLHHQTDIVPENSQTSFRRKWQKPHEPNMTGTSKAYRPPGHILEGGQRDKATGDFEAWRPE